MQKQINRQAHSAATHTDGVKTSKTNQKRSKKILRKDFYGQKKLKKRLM